MQFDLFPVRNKRLFLLSTHKHAVLRYDGRAKIKFHPGMRSQNKKLVGINYGSRNT